MQESQDTQAQHWQDLSLRPFAGLTEDDRLTIVASLSAILLISIIWGWLYLVLLPWHRRKAFLALIPVHRFEDRPDTHANYVKSTRELHYAGYRKYTQNGQAYRVRTSVGGERIVLPMRYLTEIKNASQSIISLPHEMEELLLMRYTGVPTRTDSGTKVVRVGLTRSLGNFVESMWEECLFAFEKHMPPCNDWTSVKVYSLFAHVIASISGRMLVGTQLCRDEEWISLSLEFSHQAFGAARQLCAINKWPWSMWLAYYTDPSAAAVCARRRDAERLIRPICEERLRKLGNPNWERPNDGIQWLLEAHTNSGESTEEVANSQLRLIMAAIHNTTMSVTNDLFDLLQNPEYIDILRDEIEEVLGEENGLTKHSLTKLRKMDSFMKESQRMNPSTPITLKRMVLRDYHLHDDLVLPQGSHIAFASDAVNRDPEIYPNSDTFDGLRFYRLRSDPSVPSNETKYQFVTATPEYLNWGLGGHACPGRFFSSNEIKLTLVHLLQNYDFRWKEGDLRPESANIDWNILPDREREVEIRKRSR